MIKLSISLIVTLAVFSLKAYPQKVNKIDQLLFSGKYESAIPLLNQLIDKDSTNSQLHFRLGKAYQNLNQNKQAIENYQKAYQLNSKSIPTLINLGNCLFSMGNYPAARNTLQKILKIDSTNYQGSLLLAKTYTILGSYNKSLNIYERLIVKDSLNTYLHKQIGSVKNKMQNYLGSLASYLKAYELNETDLTVILHIMQKFYEMAAYEQALAFANNGLNTFPNNHLILKKKAQCLIGLEWYENALNIFEDLNERNKLKLSDYKQFGICYMQTRQYKKAINWLEKYNKTLEKDPMINFYLGVCYSRLNDSEKGIKFLEDALFYVTPSIKASMHLHLAKAYNKNRQFEKSVKEYLKNIELDDSNPETLYEIASTYEEFGNNKSKALKYYSKYIQQTSDIGGERYEYAKSRILYIKEKIHFEK
nr:tetratricopeptide repeat protein [uncultured Marinifilum sp.]